MPAGVRGGSLAQAKPRPKASAKPRSARPRRARAVEYAPAKLRAAQASGMSPQARRWRSPPWCWSPALGVALGHRRPLATACQAGMTDGVDRPGRPSSASSSNAVHVQGASPMAERRHPRAPPGLTKDQPLLGLDLDAAARARSRRVGWVKEAKVVRLLPDTLVIAVKERPTSWRSGRTSGAAVVIDAEGRPIPEADPARFPNLPLVVGEGGRPGRRRHPAADPPAAARWPSGWRPWCASTTAAGTCG